MVRRENWHVKLGVFIVGVARECIMVTVSVPVSTPYKALNPQVTTQCGCRCCCDCNREHFENSGSGLGGFRK